MYEGKVIASICLFPESVRQRQKLGLDLHKGSAGQVVADSADVQARRRGVWDN